MLFRTFLAFACSFKEHNSRFQEFPAPRSTVLEEMANESAATWPQVSTVLCNAALEQIFLFQKHFSEFHIRGDIEDNSKIIFLIS